LAGVLQLAHDVLHWVCSQFGLLTSQTGGPDG
jgi:hypothetical protein